MNHYNSIYLAPHLDDVALSCGGQIAQQSRSGHSVLIVTVMAGDPGADQISDYARGLQERWELLTDAAVGRRLEDQEACRILGAAFQHWTVPDCPYRLHPQTGLPFYTSDAEIFGEIHPAERDWVQDLADQMERLPTWDRLVVPLTLGHHVDHQLTRRAAEFAFGASRLFYYEDYPYAQQAGALESVIGAARAGWHAQTVPLTAADLATKIEAIAAFRSQLSTFWHSREALEQQVQGFAAQVGGERIWQQG